MPSEKIECPFFVNVFGLKGKWKATKVNFAHNHAKHVGFTQGSFVEGTISRPSSVLRNTALDLHQFTTLVMTEMSPMHNQSVSTLTGAAIHEFLLSKGSDVGRSPSSRMKLMLKTGS